MSALHTGVLWELHTTSGEVSGAVHGSKMPLCLACSTLETEEVSQAATGISLGMR